MDNILMNSENSKTSEPCVLILQTDTFTDKVDLRSGEKNIAFTNLSICYTWKNIKSSYNNNTPKISTPTWNDKFELLNGPYSVSDIRDYFEYIQKKYNEKIDNPSIKIYVNKTKIELHLELKQDIMLSF